MEITKQTRRAAYRTRPVTRAREIVKFMGEREMTAREPFAKVIEISSLPNIKFL